MNEKWSLRPNANAWHVLDMGPRMNDYARFCIQTILGTAAAEEKKTQWHATLIVDIFGGWFAVMPCLKPTTRPEP